MKHILIVITSFRHGGTNRSLENLLSVIDTTKNRIDVFAMEHYGPYTTMLPNCHILTKDAWTEALIARWGDTKGTLKLKSLFVKLARNVCKCINVDITDSIFQNVSKRLSKKKYDTIIAYSEGVPTYFVRYFKNQNKIAWIHCDYSSYLRLNKYPDEIMLYASYKSIVCVSEYTKREFCRIIPSLSDRVYAIHNILNTPSIIKQSNESITDNRFDNKQFNIISIGRIDSVKQFSKLPLIVRTLIDKGCNFRWYLIGPKGQSNEQMELQKNIEKYSVENHFYWLGIKDNPYPYIVQSNLLVSVSISEACPYVINEAKVLHTPIVCTNYSSAIEFIEDGVNGFISPIEQIASKIELLIKNTEEYNNIKKNISKYVYDNEKIFEQIYKLLE